MASPFDALPAKGLYYPVLFSSIRKLLRGKRIKCEYTVRPGIMEIYPEGYAHFPHLSIYRTWADYQEGYCTVVVNREWGITYSFPCESAEDLFLKLHRIGILKAAEFDLIGLLSPAVPFPSSSLALYRFLRRAIKVEDRIIRKPVKYDFFNSQVMAAR